MHKRGRSWWKLCTTVVAVPVVYVLSIGLVWWLLLNHHISPDTYDLITTTLYAPLFWCADRFTWLNDFIYWYAHFFE